MPWPHPVVAVVAAVVTGWGALRVVRWLPEPLDDPDAADKTPYRALATPGFAVAVGLAALVACGLTVALVPVDVWLAWAALAVVGVVAAAIDARTTYLPLPLARAGWGVAAAGVGLTALLRRDPGPLLWGAVGAAGLWLFFEVFWRLSRGIGYGDVRLMATVGAVTGAHDPTFVLPAALAGAILGALWGIALRMRGHTGAFAYGPALLAGPFVTLAVAALAR